MDNIGTLVFRIIGEAVLAALCIFIGTSTSRKLFQDNATYARWCKEFVQKPGSSMEAVIRRRHEHHRRERQILTIVVAFVVTVITVTHIWMDAHQLYIHPQQHEVRILVLSVAWGMALLGLSGSLFDAGYYIVRRHRFRKEYYSIDDPTAKRWWHDRNWPILNKQQILHANRGILLFTVGWFSLLTALQLTYNIAGK